MSWQVFNAGTLPTYRAVDGSLDLAQRRGRSKSSVCRWTTTTSDPCRWRRSESRTRSYTFNLPHGNAGAGALTFEVETDIGNDIAESAAGVAAESNNATLRIVQSALAPYPGSPGLESLG